jgi:hypothetical protein
MVPADDLDPSEPPCEGSTTLRRFLRSTPQAGQFMTQLISILDFPNLNDRHDSTRDEYKLVHTQPELRRYRDFMIVTAGLNTAYDHLTHSINRSLKNYFHETFGTPYYRLCCKIDALANEALMAASRIVLAVHLRVPNQIRKQENELLWEITGGVGNISHGFFPDQWDALDRLRRLYAMRASLAAQEILPAVPSAAEILSREFGGDVALPRFSDEMYEVQRREIRDIAERYPREEAFAQLDASMPPISPVWDQESVIDEICQVIIRTYLDQVEDDAFMDAWVEKMRPRLNKYGEPTDEQMRAVEVLLADPDKSWHHRFDDRLYPGAIEWIAAAEACGHSIDARVLHKIGYQAPPDEA